MKYRSVLFTFFILWPALTPDGQSDQPNRPDNVFLSADDQQAHTIGAIGKRSTSPRRSGEGGVPLTKEAKASTIPVAHRGLLRHAPENTLPAFAACLELGIGLELDVRTTKDGHLVVLHDDNVQRTTNGPSRSVRDMTLHDLKKLDAGRWFDSAYAGVRVPTLEETLSLVRERKHGPTIIALNVKNVTPEGEAKLVALVEKYQLLNESFDFFDICDW